MAKCKACGAPVNLAPDGDPKYEKPYDSSRTTAYELLKALENLLQYVDFYLKPSNGPLLDEVRTVIAKARIKL